MLRKSCFDNKLLVRESKGDKLISDLLIISVLLGLGLMPLIGFGISFRKISLILSLDLANLSFLFKFILSK